jgi:hypothetical protein
MGFCGTWKQVAMLTALVASSFDVACTFEHYPYASNSSPTGGATSCDASSGCTGITGGGGAAICDAGSNCALTTTGGSSAQLTTASDQCPGDAGARCEPACTIEQTYAKSFPDSLVAYFSFNGEGDKWLRADIGQYTLQGYPSSQAAHMRDDTTRVNGQGNSLDFDGTQSIAYAGRKGDRLFPGAESSGATPGFTIIAWFSAEPELPVGDKGSEATRVMPIVSTMAPDDCGYQLDLRWTTGDPNPSLVFSYGSLDRGDAGRLCTLTQLSYRTPVSVYNTTKAWGLSHWHYAYASYALDPNSGLATLTLYFDGKRVANDIGQTTGVGPPIAYSAYTFYLGASGRDAEKLKGTIDDVAVLDRPLSSGDPWQFLGALTPNSGPSHCVWYPWESWDKTATAPSTCTWQSDSDRDNAHFIVKDADWGGGGINAPFTPPKDLSHYDAAYVDATITLNKALQFQLYDADGSGYCAWALLGQGIRHLYTIDLSKPDYCFTAGCAFKFDHISSLTLGAEWTTQAVSNPTPDNPVRAPGPVEVTLHSVDFAIGPLNADATTFGGAIGPNGWCWRPAAFDLMAHTSWNGVPSLASVSVTLTGMESSSTQVLADFGDQPIQVQEGACVMIDASANQAYYAASEEVSFNITDVFGVTRTWNVLLSSPSHPARCVLQLVDPTWSNEAPHQLQYQNFPDHMDLSKIGRVTFQKPYNYNTYDSVPVELTIRNVTIHPDDGQGCSTYRGDAGYCNR